MCYNIFYVAISHLENAMSSQQKEFLQLEKKAIIMASKGGMSRSELQTSEASQECFRRGGAVMAQNCTKLQHRRAC